MFFPTLESIATTDVISTDINDTVYDALQKMHQHSHRSIVVVNGPLHHIITSKDLIRLKVEGIDFSTPLSQIELRTLPLLDKASNVVNALNVTDDQGEHICVCNEDGSLFGIVTNSDIVASVDPQVVLESLQIGSVFDKKFGFKSFDRSVTMNTVLEYMKDSPMDCVIIQEGSRPAGIITSKDILKFIDDAKCHSIEAGEVMSSPLETMSMRASINDALDFFKTRQYKRIVVVDDDALILGIITQQDLISRTYLKWSQLVHEHFHQFEELTQILQKKNQHLASLATKDPLTSINNRHMFSELFEKEAASVKRYHSNLSLMMVDLDHFKAVNDTYGHNIGDYVLKTFTSIVLGSIRDADIFARWGGEEFVLLLRHTNCDEAYGVAEKIRRAVEAYDFGNVHQITCSIGVTNVSKEDTLHSAIERADRALYEAKHQGRNRTIPCSGCDRV
ncbi:MAG TPA: diguanylate cyclase [Sulfuricurvum sp.]|nr:diguanylate cyclase [Sulfuricurvum sp.]